MSTDGMNGITENIRLFVDDKMCLEEMCDCERLLEAYGVRIDWDSMEDVVEGYTVDAEWTYPAEWGANRLRNIIECEFGGAIRLVEEEE